MSFLSFDLGIAKAMSSADFALAGALLASAADFEASGKEMKKEARQLRRVLRELGYVRAEVSGDGICERTRTPTLTSLGFHISMER